jgi:hypothetical protein
MLGGCCLRLTKPSQDVNLQAELAPGIAEIVRQARTPVVAVDVKTVIEHEPLLAVGHEGAAEDLAVRKEEVEPTAISAGMTEARGSSDRLQ